MFKRCRSCGFRSDFATWVVDSKRKGMGIHYYLSNLIGANGCCNSGKMIILLDIVHHYDIFVKKMSWFGFVEFELFKNTQFHMFKIEYLKIVRKSKFYCSIVVYTFFWTQGYLVYKFWTCRSLDMILVIRGIICPKCRKFRNLENVYHRIGNLITNSKPEESSKTELQISRYEF